MFFDISDAEMAFPTDSDLYFENYDGISSLLALTFPFLLRRKLDSDSKSAEAMISL